MTPPHTSVLRGTSAERQRLHRDCASAEQPRSGVHRGLAHGTSQEGFDAEWRRINVLTVEGDLINRGEIFDEADLDAALARFEELHPQAPRLENAASQVLERFLAHFAARDWDVMAEMLADDIFTDDRRAAVGGGSYGTIEMSTSRTCGPSPTSGPKALRRQLLRPAGSASLSVRLRFSGRDQRPDAFHADMLGIVEIDADNRITASPDVRPRRHRRRVRGTRRAIPVLAKRPPTRTPGRSSRGLYAAFNRHELPGTTPDWVVHRPSAGHQRSRTSDLPAAIRAGWDLTPDISIYIEAVHRLSDLGAVVTHTAHGISQRTSTPSGA